MNQPPKKLLLHKFKRTGWSSLDLYKDLKGYERIGFQKSLKESCYIGEMRIPFSVQSMNVKKEHPGGDAQAVKDSRQLGSAASTAYVYPPEVLCGGGHGLH